MIFIIFTFLIFGGWYVWVKIRGTDMVKVKFDYTTKKTSRISTWKIIVALLFLMLIFILAFTSDSMQTSAGRKVNFLIVGIVVCIYIAVILFFNIQRIKIKKFKKSVDFFTGLSYNTKRATDEANKTKKNNKPSTFSSAGRAVDS